MPSISPLQVSKPDSSVSPEQSEGRESHFSLEELFFSTTDQRGIITACNDVFVRVSGYPLLELRGSPHNIIRHPDMPAGVFQMLWQNMKGGKPFGGYVKNRAQSGAPYWVFTVNVPIESGYLSVRFKPTTPLLQSVKSLYGEIRGRELAERAAGQTAPDVARRSAEWIREALQPLGFADYTSFAQHALSSEMRSRDALLQHRVAVPLDPSRVDPESVDELAPLYRAAFKTHQDLDKLFHQLDRFTCLGDALKTTTEQVISVTSDFFLSAMNANIAAQHLGESGLGLGTVARFLGAYGAKLGMETGALSDRIREACQVNEGVTGSIALARLQLEMILRFLSELAQLAVRDSEIDRLWMLKDGLMGTLEAIDLLLRGLQARMPGLAGHNDTLLKTVLNLEVTQISGLTEAARIPDAVDLGVMFERFRQRIGEARSSLRSLGDAIEALTELAKGGPKIMNRVKVGAGEMQAMLRQARFSQNNPCQGADKAAT